MCWLLTSRFVVCINIHLSLKESSKYVGCIVNTIERYSVFISLRLGEIKKRGSTRHIHSVQTCIQQIRSFRN